MDYELLHNVDRYARDDTDDGNWAGEWRPHHRLARYWNGSIEVPANGLVPAGDAGLDGATSSPVLERLWLRHNRDDRPCGRSGPSLSVGDVVRLADGTAFTPTRLGWKRIDGVLVVLDVTYLDYVAGTGT